MTLRTPIISLLLLGLATSCDAPPRPAPPKPYVPIIWKDVRALIGTHDTNVHVVWCEAYSQERVGFGICSKTSNAKALPIGEGSEGAKLFSEVIKHQLHNDNVALSPEQTLQNVQQLLRDFQLVYPKQLPKGALELYMASTAKAKEACVIRACGDQLKDIRRLLLNYTAGPEAFTQVTLLTTPKMPEKLATGSSASLMEQKKAVKEWTVDLNEQEDVTSLNAPEIYGMRHAMHLYDTALNGHVFALGTTRFWTQKALKTTNLHTIWEQDGQELQVRTNKAQTVDFALLYEHETTKGGLSICTNTERTPCFNEVSTLLTGHEVTHVGDDVDVIRLKRKGPVQRIEIGDIEPHMMALATAWAANHQSVNQVVREQIEVALVTQNAQPSRYNTIRDSAVRDIPGHYYKIMYWPHREVVTVNAADKIGYVPPAPSRARTRNGVTPVPVPLRTNSYRSGTRRSSYRSTPSSTRTWNSRSSRSGSSRSSRSFRSGSSRSSRSSGGYRSGKN